MILDTHPVALGIGQPAQSWADFRIHNSRDIAAVMRQLRDASVPIVLNAPDGTALTLTLWAFDADHRRLSFNADTNEPVLARFVEADEAVAVAYLENVKLQFDLHDMMVVHGPQASALQAAMPRELYRFQRRSAFRVRIAESRAPTACLRHPAMPDMQLTLRVLDISIGGCALLVPEDVPQIEPVGRLAGVRVELDPDTRFTAEIQLLHVTSMQCDAGRRLGCEWSQIDVTAQRSLQRFIDRTQRRRRLQALWLTL
jgi:c-di-GMP-binding flagellar brake protein YcgR